jgi:hypothetical protein
VGASLADAAGAAALREAGCEAGSSSSRRKRIFPLPTLAVFPRLGRRGPDLLDLELPCNAGVPEAFDISTIVSSRSLALVGDQDTNVLDLSRTHLWWRSGRRCNRSPHSVNLCPSVQPAGIATRAVRSPWCFGLATAEQECRQRWEARVTQVSVPTADGAARARQSQRRGLEAGRDEHTDGLPPGELRVEPERLEDGTCLVSVRERLT